MSSRRYPAQEAEDNPTRGYTDVIELSAQMRAASLNHVRDPETAAVLNPEIGRLIREAVAATGQAPTDDQLARLLAITPERVRHHRRMIGA